MAKINTLQANGTERRSSNLKKWNTLQHKGPQFHPPYKRLGVKFKYSNKIMQLTKSSEEVVVMYSKYLLRNSTPKKIFRENFFKDWREKYMSSNERKQITHFNQCNFTLVKKRLISLKEERKLLSKRQREKIKLEREEAKKKFSYAFVNGQKEMINNFMVEPPGLYMGRGNNKYMGRIKARIEPEHVTINCSQNCRPRPPPGRQWKEIVHDQSNIWFACYRDSIMDKMRYIFPHASSTIKSRNDEEKFDKAKELGSSIVRIRATYRRHLNDGSVNIRQHATAVYFLDKIAIRIGNEIDPGESDTVGCCTLRMEHVKLLNPAKKRTIKLRFFGKDSVLFDRDIIVSKAVYQNLRKFSKNTKTNTQKRAHHLIFDEITPKSLNDYLATMMHGLTAKVFRTYKATECYSINVEHFATYLNENSSIREIRVAHLKANLEVAKLLNHMIMATNSKKVQGRALVKHEEKVEKMQEDYDLIRRKRYILQSEEYREREVVKKELQVLEDELTIKKARTTWALATSLVNYIDPRTVRAWCDEYDLDVKYVYSKAQQAKFRWAL